MRRAATLAFVVGAFIALGAVPAHANHVECGDTITANTTLDSDLTNCPGNGVVIGADDIRLDLNGHTIDGDAVLGCSEEEVCDLGVDNTAGHHGVTVEDGSIREFATGIFVFGGNENRLRDLSSSNNLFGGLLLVESVGSEIVGTSISANGLETDEGGLLVFGAQETLIEGNSVFANGDIGLLMEGSEANRVERNSISDNPEAGMILEGASNYVGRNDLARNGDGIVFLGDGNRIVRNDIIEALGCPDGCGYGISFEGGADNRIARNFVLRARAVGIRVTYFPPDTPVPVDNAVRRNVVRKSGDDGIFVGEGSERTQVIRNTASKNHGDGIDVDAPATKLARNRANRNRELGIEAVNGVKDGGGNRARGNGKPAQCTHVAC